MALSLYAHIQFIDDTPAICISQNGKPSSVIPADSIEHAKLWVDIAQNIWKTWSVNAKAEDDKFKVLSRLSDIEVNLDEETVENLEQSFAKTMTEIAEAAVKASERYSDEDGAKAIFIEAMLHEALLLTINEEAAADAT